MDFEVAQYQTEYNKLIENARSENRIKLNPSSPWYVCYHEHHIKPKSVFPELKDDKDNLVLLTPEEHWEAHYLLWKGNPSVLEYAADFYFISHTNKKQITKEEYSKLKNEESRCLSEKMSGSKNPMYGKNVYAFKTKEELDEIKHKIAENNKGKKHGTSIYNPTTGSLLYIKSYRELPMGYVLGGKPKSKESRKKMSEAAKNRGAPKIAFRDKHGKNNPMFGKSQSEESRKKQSETRKQNALKNPYYGCTGKKAYYNKNTHIIKYFKPDDVIPENYIKGRPPKEC